MLRKASEAVSEGNGPTPQQEEFESGQPTLADAFRELREKECKNLMDEIRRNLEQHLASLEQDARQSRLPMEADGHANIKTRERTEGAATAVPAMQRDSWTTAQKVQDGPKTSITFGVEAEPPDLPRRHDVLVEGGDAAPKPCLPSLEIRSPTAADGLLPIGKTSTSTETSTFNEPFLRLCVTEESNLKKNVWTPTPSAWYDSSFWKLLHAPCLRVVETKPMENRTFDPDGSQGDLRACAFMGMWRALVCGGAVCAGAAGIDCSSFFGGSLVRDSKVFMREPYEQSFMPYV